MNRLLSTNFARLWRSKIFWLSSLSMTSWALLTLLTEAQVAQEFRSLDQTFFQFSALIGGFCAVFCGLFIGTDYSDGTIRNKLVIGHSRQAIYGANLIVCTTVGLLIWLAWVIPMLLVGVPTLGWFQSSPEVLLIHLLITALMITAFVSISTFISMLLPNKANAAIFSLLIFLLTLFASSYCINRLSEPEMYQEALVFSESGVQLSEPLLNSSYISGKLRSLYSFVADFLPAGQGIQISSMEAKNPFVMSLYSLLILISCSLSGILIFRKKDLK